MEKQYAITKYYRKFLVYAVYVHLAVILVGDSFFIVKPPGPIAEGMLFSPRTAATVPEFLGGHFLEFSRIPEFL